MKRLVLIDGHAILHRAYHAFPKNLTTRKGELVNAVYGFTRMLFGVIKDLKPDYLAVTFDLPKPTFRHEIFLGYQSKRPRMDAELADQIERVHQIVEVLNLPIFEMAGFEADDLIGTLTKQASKKNVATIIVTGDRDIMQLVNQKVKVYAPIRGFSGAELFGRKKVRQLLDVWPEQIVDYKALVGDASDNYPGVPGVGPKTATKLLAKYKNLGAIFKNTAKIEPRVVNKLTDGRELAFLCQKLAKIVTNVPIKLSLKACRVHDYDQEKARKLFEELGFRSLINKLPGIKPVVSEKKKAKNGQIKLL